MRSDTQLLYDRKARWMRKVSKLNLEIIKAMRAATSGALSALPMHLVALGTKIKRLGEEGEGIWQAYFDGGRAQWAVDSIADQLNLLEDLSHRVGQAARRVAGMELGSYNYYVNTKTIRFR